MTDTPTRSAGAVAAASRRALQRGLDALFPPLCLSCHAAVGEAGHLCAPCWSQITFISDPVCAACGTPLAFSVTDSPLCGACHAQRPRVSRARAALRYDPVSRPLVLAFKHGDRLHAAASFVPWMQRAGAELLAEADLIAPIPLHWWRLFRRRYNQAAELARPLAARTGIAFAADLLVRQRATRSQGDMPSARARVRNVAGAFKVAEGWLPRVRGARVLLVDDVMTTGATLASAARALTRAGAADVTAVTLARVVREGGSPLY